MKVVARWASGALCAVPWRCTGDRPSRDGQEPKELLKAFLESWRILIKTICEVFSSGVFFWLFWPKVITTSKSVAAILKELRPEVQLSSISQVRKGNGDWYRAYPWQAGCIVLPQWEPLSNLDEWLTLGGIIITSEEEPEGDLCSDLGKTTRIGHRFGNVGWRWRLVRWLALQHCGGDGWSYWDGYYFRRCRWKRAAQCRCNLWIVSWQNRNTLGYVETGLDCHAGSVVTISVGST